MKPTLQDILSQDRWLRRTALALTRDAWAAEDLAQDAWVAGLENERTGAGDRPWFRGLLRHRLAGERRAAASARSKARRSVESGIPVEAPTDELAQARELRQAVARGVLELEEPLRRAVYLRFIAGQSNAEVARDIGVAESTASERVCRGLEELRRRLDASVRGGRAAWAPALTRIAVPPEAVPAAGVGAVGIAAATALLVGGGAVAFWSGPADGGLPGPAESGAPLVATGESQEGPADEPAGHPVNPESIGTRAEIPAAVDPSRRRRGSVGAPPPVRVLDAAATATPPPAPKLGDGPPRLAPEGAITVRVVEPVNFQFFGAPLDETRVLLVSESSPRRVEHPTPSELEPSVLDTFDIAFDAPSPGRHRVEISDPRFDPYVSEPVAPGEKADVRLVGSASLTLNVQGPGGPYPTDMEVTLVPNGFQSTVSSVVPVLGGGFIDDIVPWSYTLSVRAAEGTGRVEISELAPMENRTVNVSLAARAKVTGLIEYPSGHPATGTLVRLVRYRGTHRPRTQIAEVGEVWSISPQRMAVSETAAGARGEFTLRAEEAGRYVVVAGRAGEPQVESDPIELGRSEAVDSIQLTVARGGRVLGQIKADAGTKLAGSQVLTFDREGKSTRPTFPRPHRVAADGRFEISPLPAGKVSIHWYPPGHNQFGADMSGRPVGGRFLGEVEVTEDETTRATLTLPRQP